ncbi:DEAD/DEAH box helicase family protein [Agathobacter sp. LCP21S3_B2]|uniref:DEAD/DEAH box helicase family protein n=1 Tax=Agathobacter sp. LCP21S3_B2 TaxID=3438734 RepID=UPI003F912D02
MQEYIEVKSNGKIIAKKGTNPRSPYNHQKDAMAKLSLIDKEESFSTLVVLPTGGGKTYTASTWLLKNAIDKKKKILWIAHRQMLLDQAAESFQRFAYAEAMPHISEFTYRIVSGSSNHDRSIDISPRDNILILSKDSIGRNLSVLDKWLKGENEVYCVIDEAHHATAKTYRKIINYVQERVPNMKLLGLTATPFRTAKEEEGLLSKIFKDGVDESGNVVKGDLGITYQIGLKELINARILSTPIFECKYTEEDYGADLGLDALEHIQRLDVLPEELATEIASSAARNKLIVDTYVNRAKEYGQTIVFAVNINHAIALNKLFGKAGVKSDYIVSDIRDAITGVTISREDNERKLQQYRDGKLQVLINVNILTEGVDLPQTKTVFLARPTVSKILMTQMVGRALRGTAAGGTAKAYIVSFVDQWNENIAWCNPASLFHGENDFEDNEVERTKRQISMIAISKIEEFASMLDDSIDTSALEKVPFEQRFPIGMYAFTYLDGMDISYQVMVYDSTKESYEQLMESLPELFSSYGLEDEEYLSNEMLEELEEQCRNTYFCGDMVPPYEKRDIINILKYYAQKEEAPEFYTFDDIDTRRLDPSVIAKHIYDEDMGERRRNEYINSLWESNDDNLLRLFFGRKIYFLKQVQLELMKISHPDVFEEEHNVVFGKRNFEDMALCEIGKVAPEVEKELRDKAFERARNSKGLYECAACKMTSHNRIPFQIDHIIPLNKGGKTIPENLQVLCRKCNASKSDKVMDI